MERREGNRLILKTLRKKVVLFFIVMVLVLQGFTSTIVGGEVDDKDPYLDILTNQEATTEGVVVQVQAEFSTFRMLEIKLPKGATYDEEKTRSIQQGATLDYNAKKHVLTLKGEKGVPEQQIAFVLSNLEQSHNALAITGKLDGNVVFEEDYSFQVKEVPDSSKPEKKKQNKETSENKVEKEKNEEKEKNKKEAVKPEAENKDSIKQQGQQQQYPSYTTPAKYMAKINTNWPNPGSLKLLKEAKSTDEYGEWEIELTAQGKNLKQKSDVVLLFDRSNTMYGSRVHKAKQAAQQFVENLLTEDATTRIALVPFGTEADRHVDFKGHSEKQVLKRAIERIRVTGGPDGATNIQAGLHKAKQLLNRSNADRKTIVLLSDGEPTFSFRAGKAEGYTWPNNRYNFMLSDFNYNELIGSGASYYLGWESYWLDGFRVRTNGIATLSEAVQIMTSGNDIYSIGIDVGDYEEAIYVLKNSQNRGYYEGTEDELQQIFTEISADLSHYAASNSVVTDPMGDMFNLVKDGSYSGKNFSASHGEVNWNEAKETFTWDIGDIKENETYTLKYKVTIDWDKNPKGNERYPTNKDTPLNYTDPNGDPQTKPFPIPEAGIDKGKIIKKGYRVNVDGDPIDQNGNVVSDPSLAEQFYEEAHQENDQQELKFNETYQVTANDVTDYTLHVGENPTRVSLKADNPIEKVWFGYVKETDLIAGDVTAEYVDEEGNKIASNEIFTGKLGDTYTTKQKDISGYTFVKVDEEGAPATGKFQKDPQTVRYIYKQELGTLTVQKVDENGETLQGATFELKNANGEIVESQETNEAGIAEFKELSWGEYELTETKAPEGYRLLNNPIHVEISAENLHEEIEVENSKNGWILPDTGGIGTLLFYGSGVGLMLVAILLFIRKKRRDQTSKEQITSTENTL